MKRVSLLTKSNQSINITRQASKKNFHGDIKNVFEPVTKTIKDTPEDATKTNTETSKGKDKELAKSNNKLLDIMKDRGILASYLLSPLPKITNPEQTSRIKRVESPDTNRVKYLLILKNQLPYMKVS